MLVATPTEQPRLRAEGIVERDLGPLQEVLAAILLEPATVLEAFFAVGVLNHPVECDVLRAAHHGFSHFSSLLVCCLFQAADVDAKESQTGRPFNAQFAFRAASTYRRK